MVRFHHLWARDGDTFGCDLVAKSYPTLCDSDGTSQARILEWVAVSFSR